MPLLGLRREVVLPHAEFLDGPRPSCTRSLSATRSATGPNRFVAHVLYPQKMRVLINADAAFSPASPRHIYPHSGAVFPPVHRSYSLSGKFPPSKSKCKVFAQSCAPGAQRGCTRIVHPAVTKPPPARRADHGSLTLPHCLPSPTTGQLIISTNGTTPGHRIGQVAAAWRFLLLLEFMCYRTAWSDLTGSSVS